MTYPSKIKVSDNDGSKMDGDRESEILRYHFVEQWKVGTIASQLGIHPSL